MNEFNRKQELKRYLVWFVVGLTFVLAMEGTRVNPGALFDRDGIRNAGELLSGLLSPNLSPDFLQRIFLLSFESLFVGILGTVFAVVIGIGLAMFAIRIPELPDPPGRQGRRQSFVVATARTISRFTLGFFRSIPEIVWAYLFVQILGLGPGADATGARFGRPPGLARSGRVVTSGRECRRCSTATSMASIVPTSWARRRS